jgi:hypothetical protein
LSGKLYLCWVDDLPKHRNLPGPRDMPRVCNL